MSSNPTNNAKKCRNCGEFLRGNFCSNCSQRSRLKITWASLTGIITQSIFAFDSSIWRTILGVLWNCGRVSNNYIEGKRKSYVGPAQMFLGCALLMTISSEVNIGSRKYVSKPLSGRSPVIEEHPSLGFYTVSIEDLEEGSQAYFSWGGKFKDEASEIYQEYSHDIEVNATHKVSHIIPIKDNKTLTWVKASVTKNDVGEFSEKEYSKDGQLEQTWLDYLSNKAKKNPPLILFLLGFLVAVPVWLGAFTKRRTLLHCLIFSWYACSGAFIPAISVRIFTHKNSDINLDVLAIAFILVFLRGLWTFLGIGWKGWLCRILVISGISYGITFLLSQ